MAGYEYCQVNGTVSTRWAVGAKKTGTTLYKGKEPNAQEVASLMNAIYSYQYDCGGVLKAHDMQAYDALLQQLFPAHTAAWYPNYVAAEDRAKAQSQHS